MHALDVTCPRCSATPGWRCVNTLTQNVRGPHWERTEKANIAAGRYNAQKEEESETEFE